MNENEQFGQLVDYIKQHIAQGISEHSIRNVLLQHNWDAESVERAFAAAKASQSPSMVSEPNAYPQLQNHTAQSPAGQQPHGAQPAIQHNSDAMAPKKYKVFRAVGDTFRAVRQNPSTFALSVVCTYAIAAFSLFVVSLIMGKVLGGKSLLFASLSTQLMWLLGSLTLYVLWYVFAGAFAMATISLALYEGNENRRSSIGAILSQGFAKLGRIILANMLLSLIVFVPVVLIISLPLILPLSGATGGSLSLILFPITMLIAVVWSCVALIKCALIPYVALFEPNVPVFKTMGRSKYLLSKGGQWFLVKGFLFALLILIVIGVATGQNLQELSDSNGVVSNVLLMVLSIFANGVLVMLYRNRKIVRG